MRIAACYTYPVKGMTTHSMRSLELRPGESVVGDRAFIFAFGNAEIIGAHGWVSKRQSVTMLNTPYLPWIESGWDPEARVLSVTVRGQTKSAQVDDAASRVELSDWMTDVVLGLPENPLRGRPEREPLQVAGRRRGAVYRPRSNADIPGRACRRWPTCRRRRAWKSICGGSVSTSPWMAIDKWGEFDWVGQAGQDRRDGGD